MARVLVQREWRRGQHVLLIFPQEGVRSRAQIAYCERAAQSRFAVGPELSEEVDLWARRYLHHSNYAEQTWKALVPTN